MDHKLLFLMWVSGSGKSTVQPWLLATEDLQLVQVNTTTTRPMRPGEVQGDGYDFVSEDRFVELIEQGDFVEWAWVHQKYRYGTRKSLVQGVFEQGNNVLKQVDAAGREQIVAHDEVRAYARSVFMDLSDEVMRERIMSRDETVSEEEIERRLHSARHERMIAHELCDIVIDVEGMSREEQLGVVRDAMKSLVK